MKTSKIKTKFVCGQCQYESYQWLGKCPSCGAWNTFVEEKSAPSVDLQNQMGRLTDFSSQANQLKHIKEAEFKRFKTGISEFDIITGGGAVSGSLTLLGGAPGIGKSTLMLHISDKLSAFGNVLYISGEESPSQVKSRADRLNIKKENIFLASETNLQNIIEEINRVELQFLIIDSIQTVYHPLISAYPGSPAQIRESAAEILRIAKSKNITVFLLGHITKDGDLAGPRILEHLVDTVLYFENEKQHIYRILRVFKNRFGPTNEMGIFEMTSSGLKEVSNPSSVFLSQRNTQESGGIITVSMEGMRPILLEVQA
ncbi:MAG: DNA repair protein RadA, partial [Elusimicrobiota bacterium]|nr:DNA repair protein RadA [Elusimicrobiota bacterium]